MTRIGSSSGSGPGRVSATRSVLSRATKEGTARRGAVPYHQHLLVGGTSPPTSGTDHGIRIPPLGGLPTSAEAGSGEAPRQLPVASQTVMPL
jgi:hypothetical protein